MLGVVTYTMTVAGVERLAASVIISVCVFVFVCPHDKTKMTETKITKLWTFCNATVNYKKDMHTIMHITMSSVETN